MKKGLLLVLLLIINIVTGYSQRGYDSDGEFDLALNHLQYGREAEAAKILRHIIKSDSSYIKAYLYLGEIYYNNGKIEELIPVYEKGARNITKKYPDILFMLANVYYFQGYIQEAVSTYDQYLKQNKIGDEKKEMAKQLLERCNKAMEFINNPVPFNPENLGEMVNSEYGEYLPSITVDGMTLVITRKIPKNGIAFDGEDNMQEDFYISEWTNGEWGKAENMGSTVNTQRNEGAQSISADGKWLFFTACNRPEGYGGCDIYYSKLENGQWTSPVNMGVNVNSPNWDAQPSVSPDGREVYFSSDRGGGTGGSDLWKTIRDEDGQWSKPVNLGPVINTKGDEQSPFIHFDNKTLYFSSDGHLGVGGMDLFKTVLDDNRKWSEPENLGYPINTTRDDFSLIVDASGTKAYYSSSRAKGYGDLDIYSFDLYEKARPTSVTYLSGTVKTSDKDSGPSTVELINLRTGQLVSKLETDPVDGSFMVCLPAGDEYALNVSRKGYLFYSENFTLNESTTQYKPFHAEINLQPVKKGATVILKNVFFAIDSYELKPESEVELNKLYRFLTDNPSVHIEIGGHTDNTGTPEHNAVLSENRAEAVYNYLVKKGIKTSRLSFSGYAETKPVASNESEEGRALNRRTEFKVIE